MARSIVIAILVALAALPVVIFLLVMAAVFFASLPNGKHPIVTLSTLACPTCDRIYGSQTAELARQEHIDSCQEAREANPGLRINFARFWVVRCPNCQTMARFYYETESLDS
jgi:ABC-type dipeptide/oligopeptide/nickel transport system permease subunit